MFLPGHNQRQKWYDKCLLDEIVFFTVLTTPLFRRKIRWQMSTLNNNVNDRPFPITRFSDPVKHALFVLAASCIILLVLASGCADVTTQQKVGDLALRSEHLVMNRKRSTGSRPPTVTR
jgi:hypothetical protein